MLIAAERGALDLEATLATRQGEEVRIAAITVAELYEGVEGADTPLRAATRRVLVEGYIARMPVVPFTADIARDYARVKWSLRKIGRTIGIHDLQIAVTAMHLGFEVASRDERSFPKIPGLTFLRW